MGQRRTPEPARQVSLVECSDPVEVSRQTGSNRCGQGREAVDFALPVADADLMAVPIEVFDTQPETLDQPQPAAV
jgi:hypothetical protein